MIEAVIKFILMKIFKFMKNNVEVVLNAKLNVINVKRFINAMKFFFINAAK